jgi:type I restriction enzyme S subunit
MLSRGLVMGLIEGKLGNYIELRDVRNADLRYGTDRVRGVNTTKQMMQTRADLSERDLSKFQIVSPGEFVFNHRTSRNGSKFSIAYNNSASDIICTEDYVVFRISEYGKQFVLAEWLFIYFNRPEFDRYVITNSWGSSTEFYNWEDLCDVDIGFPPLSVQQKYVDVYNSMLANQRNYERGLDDMKFVCEAFIDNLKKGTVLEPIGPYLVSSDERNTISLSSNFVRGLTVSKQMIPTKADMEGVSLDNYKLVPPQYIAYVPDTSRRGDKVSLAMNSMSETVLVSSISTVFTTNREKLLPEYLMLFFSRSEFDRYARFHSWGSARETFDWDEMCAVEIPVPDIKIQQYIVNIYIAYQLRKEINEQLKAQVRGICPVLIKGSLEAKKRSD